MHLVKIKKCGTQLLLVLTNTDTTGSQRTNSKPTYCQNHGLPLGKQMDPIAMIMSGLQIPTSLEGDNELGLTSLKLGHA